MNKNKLTDKQYWDDGYKNFSFSEMPRKYPIVQKIYGFFSTKSEGKEVFEIGCFPGRFLFHFGKLGYKLNGLDQTDYLTKMEKWFNANNFSIGSFLKKDIYELGNKNKYDVVFSSGFIEHFINFEEIIRIHASLVKKDGYIFITTPNFSGKMQKSLHNFFDKENLSKHHLPSMNPKAWENVIRDEGFTVLESGYLGGFDFWVGNEKRNIFKKITIKLFTSLLPIRILPNSSSYSPEIYIIAKKI